MSKLHSASTVTNALRIDPPVAKQRRGKIQLNRALVAFATHISDSSFSIMGQKTRELGWFFAMVRYLRERFADRDGFKQQSNARH
ncbi:MAG: hypothetical protein ACLQFW_03730 [Xanthobacteraceae bacterium]